MKQYLTFLLLVATQILTAQCAFNPTVTGDTLLCPNAGGQLKTQAYDAWQWYRRVYPNGTAEAIPGATGQALNVTEADVLYYYSVEATLDSCTETSPEVLLDGWVFLLPTVQHTGEYGFDPDSETFLICEGDTMFLTLGQPYSTNITWFKNSAPIAGLTGVTLAVTEPGEYTVQGAPEVCPDYIQPLGLTLAVGYDPSCTTDVIENPGSVAGLQIFPNPAGDWLKIRWEDDETLSEVMISDLAGRSKILSANNGQYALAGLPAGFYVLRIKKGGQVFSQKLLKN